MRKDQARRLRYQEKQRVEQKAVKDSKNWVRAKQPEGKIESFLRILVK